VHAAQVKTMDPPSCPAVRGDPHSGIAMFFTSSSFYGSLTVSLVMLLAVAVHMYKLCRTNARLRSQLAELESECSGHVMRRRQSAGKVADSIGALRARTEELETELDEAHVQVGDTELHVAQLQNTVNDLHRANALSSVAREQLAASLSSQRLFFSKEIAELKGECRSAHVDKASARRELADEKQFSDDLQLEIEELNQLLLEAREELARRGAELRKSPAKGRYSEGRGDDEATKRIAELLVLELPVHSSDAIERQRAQRQLLTCLHPDKWPTSRMATMLMQEVQRCPSWIALGARGGA